ncbi:Uncharacterised protein [Vibrio cholerae]|nr:Uncharacterised protein [Vibrio cholerae]
MILPLLVNGAESVRSLKSPDATNSPCAPVPLACTTRSGIRSLAKRCNFWIR